MKNLIKNYINKITKEDITNFIQNKQYKISSKEIDIIYTTIKKYNEKILEDPLKYISTLKNKVSKNTYNEILTLYEQYKKYLK